MPVGLPKETLELCDKIIEKDTADGVNSSLSGVIDMTAFAGLVTPAENKRNEADQKDSLALSKYQLATRKSGLDTGQNKDTENTINWFAHQIKGILLVVHKGDEEALTGYGYSVVITSTGARRNIKIELPRKPEDMIQLGKDIMEEHTNLGLASPLTAALVDMTAFGNLVTDADTLLHNWELLRGQVLTLHNEALVIIGYGAGQTSAQRLEVCFTQI